MKFKLYFTKFARRQELKGVRHKYRVFYVKNIYDDIF